MALKLLTHSLTHSLTFPLSIPLIFLSLFFSLSASNFLTGCSGTSDTTSVTTSTTSSLSGKVRLSGTLATGAPIPSAAITIRDSKGNTATATSGTDGTYQVDVEDKPPYVLRVPHPNVSGKYIYSHAAKGGVTANIHPLTDPIMRAWFRAQSQDIDDAFSGYGSSSAVPIPTESEINIIKAVVKEVIKDLLRAVKDDFGTGITVDNFDPITTPFTANSIGFDKVLDGTKINMSGGTVSIAVTPDSTLETAVRTTGGNTTATLDTTNISLTADTTPPTAPTNLSALSVSSSQILLTWSASSSTDVLGYKVYQSGTEVATVTSTVYIVPALSASTSYTFTVKAFDGATNLSDASTSASATTSAAATDTTAPTAPTNLTATVVSSTQIDLSWTASTDAVGVAGYIVYRDSTAIAKVFTTTFSDIGLTANTSYIYTVKAFDGAGNKSDASTSATASTSTTTTDTIAPTAPTNLTATAVSRSEIDLSWTWTASTDAVGVSGYYVYRGTTKIGTATSTTYSDTGLSASTKYCYTVKAYDAANNVSNASTTACATTEAASGVGTKFPIATTTDTTSTDGTNKHPGREVAISAAFDGTNYLVGVQGDAVAHYNVGSQLIDKSGNLVGSRISTGRTGGAPAIAFNGTNYLMVWSDDATHPNNVIYGQVINTSGTTVKSPFAISTTTGAMEIGSVVCDSTAGIGYVVWFDRNTGTAYGRQISSTGTFLTDEQWFADATTKGNPITSVKGGVNGALGTNTLLFTWDTGVDIRGSIGNRTTGANVNLNFVIATKAPLVAGCTDHNPVGIAFDGTNYLVVWNDHSDCAETPNWDILAQRVDVNGNNIGSPFQVNSANTKRAAIPLIAFDGTNTLVTWIDGRNDANKDGICDSNEGTCYDVYGQYISKSGTLVGSEFVINNDAGNQWGFVTGFNNGKYLVLINTGLSKSATGETLFGDVYGVFITP